MSGALQQQGIHDLLVWKLSKELRQTYDSVDTNVLLRDNRRTVAEIDVVAKKEGCVHVFEVKCSFRITKAKKQCKKIQKHLGEHIDAYYMYCGATDSIVEIEI